MYNHPGHTVPDLFLSRFANLKYNNKSIKGVIVSDFNLPHENFGSRFTNAAGRDLLNQINSSSLILLNDDSPTYYCFANGEPNILDLALCDMTTMDAVDLFQIGSDMGSDHQPVHGNLVFKNKTGRSNPKIEIKNTNWSEFRSRLLEVEPQLPVLSNQPMKEEIDSFFNSFSSLILMAKTRSTTKQKCFGSGRREFCSNTVEWIKTR
jgi:hypothetical protein